MALLSTSVAYNMLVLSSAPFALRFLRWSHKMLTIASFPASLRDPLACVLLRVILVAVLLERLGVDVTFMNNLHTL